MTKDSSVLSRGQCTRRVQRLGGRDTLIPSQWARRATKFCRPRLAHKLGRRFQVKASVEICMRHSAKNELRVPGECELLSEIDRVLESDFHLRRLKGLVESNIREPFTLSDSSAKLGLSPNRLSHIFKKRTGVKYSDWIRHKRIAVAQTFLAEGRRSVLDIATSAGYKTSRSFERAFKRTTGMTPRLSFAQRLTRKMCRQFKRN